MDSLSLPYRLSITAKIINLGARAYHLRGVLHDWPDHQCKVILERTIAAMEKGYSKMIINEKILPNKGVSPVAAQVDLAVSSPA